MTDSNAPRATTSPKALALTPAQLLADNLSTRLREMVAIACYVLLAHWGLIPGQWAAGLIALTVLPIEITRQLVKPAIARGVSGGTIGGGMTLALAAIISKFHVGLTTLPVVATFLAALLR
jgi:hypothetical protein